MTDQIARTPKQAGEAVRRRRRALGMNAKGYSRKDQPAASDNLGGRGGGTGHAAAHAL